MRNITITIIGIAIGFVNTMFLQSFGETISTIINLLALLFILVGIVGAFREKI